MLVLVAVVRALVFIGAIFTIFTFVESQEVYAANSGASGSEVEFSYRVWEIFGETSKDEWDKARLHDEDEVAGLKIIPKASVHFLPTAGRYGGYGASFQVKF